jgi:hypothetical protein
MTEASWQLWMPPKEHFPYSLCADMTLMWINTQRGFWSDHAVCHARLPAIGLVPLVLLGSLNDG